MSHIILNLKTHSSLIFFLSRDGSLLMVLGLKMQHKFMLNVSSVLQLGFNCHSSCFHFCCLKQSDYLDSNVSGNIIGMVGKQLASCSASLVTGRQNGVFGCLPIRFLPKLCPASTSYLKPFNSEICHYITVRHYGNSASGHL